jgi:hypothetical protein
VEEQRADQRHHSSMRKGVVVSYLCLGETEESIRSGKREEFFGLRPRHESFVEQELCAGRDHFDGSLRASDFSHCEWQATILSLQGCKDGLQPRGNGTGSI